MSGMNASPLRCSCFHIAAEVSLNSSFHRSQQNLVWKSGGAAIRRPSIPPRMMGKIVRWINTKMCCYKSPGQTIVANNFFTTLAAAKRLAALGLALVGSIRSTKKFLPEKVKRSASRSLVCIWVSRKLGFPVQQCAKKQQSRQFAVHRTLFKGLFGRWKKNQERLYFTIKTKPELTVWTKWFHFFFFEQKRQPNVGALHCFTCCILWGWLRITFVRKSMDSFEDVLAALS